MDFNESDLLAIQKAHSEDSLWSSDILKGVKEKIKSQLLEECTHCCYCRRPFKSEFKMVIDIEHILPSSIFRELAFDKRNLSLSCKRCNMVIKKDRLDFLNGNLEKIGNYLKGKSKLSRYVGQCPRIKNIAKLNRIIYSSFNYKFIHPILDLYANHLDYMNIQINDESLVVYVPKTNKGVYTKDFFLLSEFQTRDLNVNIQSLYDPENISGYDIPPVL
ncbi:HNH endonuclease [Acinetobacter baumannii]|nr:HNH endonuclease [Acinetobacter baumannii]